jgi:hypothetical protein
LRRQGIDIDNEDFEEISNSKDSHHIEELSDKEL